MLTIKNFSILVLAVLAGKVGAENQNLCPEVKGCVCYDRTGTQLRQEYDLVLRCSGVTDPLLQQIPHKRIERIIFSKTIFTNTSTLYELRKTNAKRISFIHNKFAIDENVLFDWDWLPDTARNFSMIGNGIRGFRSGNRTGDQCAITRLSDFSIYMNEENFTGLPSCIPGKSHTITLSNLPTKPVQNKIRMPSGVTILKLINAGKWNFSENLFLNHPQSLHTIWMSRQKLKKGSWPVGLPAPSLKRLILISLEMTTVPAEEIAKFRSANQLTFLSLNFNNLTEVPMGLPGSLKTLFIQSNKIQHVREECWSTMVNLTKLNLADNQLSKVPLKMPSTLQHIALPGNDIAYSEPGAFINMKNLKVLDLSRNKLTTLPRGIQPSLVTYIIHTNQISLVQDPGEYDFCGQCQNIQLYGNPWHCNIQMLQMLGWLVLHNVTMPYYGSNRKTNIPHCSGIAMKEGFDTSWWKVAIEYMEYYNKPPNDACSYEIESLKCHNTDLTELPERIPPSLKEINITDNPNLTSIPDYKFSTQTGLRKLILDNNSLSHVPIGLPSNLRVLSLRHNSLGAWNDQDLSAFQNITELRQLYLEDNNIKVLYGWQFDGIKDLKWIGLGGNPLHCDCSLQSFAYWFEEKVERGTSFIGPTYPACKTPQSHIHMDIRHLRGYFRHGVNCVPQKCTWNGPTLNCSKAYQKYDSHGSIYITEFVPGEDVDIIANTYWTTLDLSGLALKTDQIDYRNLTRLQDVDLSNNMNTEVPLSGLPPSVQVLNLSRNQIDNLPSHQTLSKYFPKLRILDLTYNRIKVIDSQVGNLELIDHLLLAGNPFVCNCSLRPLVEWIHVNKENEKMNERHQLQALTCHFKTRPTVRYIADVTLGDYCPDLPVAAIIGGVAAGVVFLLVIVVLVNVYFQRKRHRHIQEEILGFQGLLEKEKEEDGKDPETGMRVGKEHKFDAFLSYDANGVDTEFVITLLEELEDKHGYKLCLSERDFIPGAGIADNIVECIGVSKHVILVLSKSFASSPWCQYEVQAALAELHQRRKSQLLISILLDDISTDEDLAGSVKTFLTLVPAIHVPQYMPDQGKEWKDFWDRLIEAMPDPIDAA